MSLVLLKNPTAHARQQSHRLQLLVKSSISDPAFQHWLILIKIKETKLSQPKWETRIPAHAAIAAQQANKGDTWTLYFQVFSSSARFSFHRLFYFSSGVEMVTGIAGTCRPAPCGSGYFLGIGTDCAGTWSWHQACQSSKIIWIVLLVTEFSFR